MANLTKLDFIALDVSGTNYLSWVLDAELHLASNKLGETVKENTTASEQDCAKAMILLRHHLHESLKSQYLTVKSPFQLWKSLKDRFDHQKTVILPRARYEWIQLRLQDFKTIAEYNSEMFRIVSKLRLCGEDVTDEQMLEKTFCTFHASNLVLQQQYRERGFKTYSELISCLLVAEENNQLLLNNHHTRPTGSKPLPENSAALPEANATSSRKGSGRYHGSPQGHSYGRGHGCGRGHGGRGRGRGNDRGNHHNTWINPNIQKKNGIKAKNQHEKTTNGDICHRCGMSGHWSRTCRTAPHLVKLYQASLKAKGKEVETNFVEAGISDNTHIDASDFFQSIENDDKDLPELPLQFGDIPEDFSNLAD
ncbi:UNVERIFIED_CONTAM: hypothetical protein Scaly_1101500 [Sesamum calycinum]|uniref:CCHC-type domain-containing protein n=1 Tax=Sesamum calycinum TaxID=2727403 RepID=A0AAW2QLL9_9LAMI